ncbi:hypothetical protein BS47DRAFT_1387037 [Hydnum rufescens UP504]|uniref:Uncharacterized protein n=1 Tax=Hydnum rufescens UP504 TaxID=1448309 RepID=A0A9P6BCK4_9AGAM|nr:hypothetical protein BS47DRAFT_1387037 [Hydnum rufescens UP504]
MYPPQRRPSPTRITLDHPSSSFESPAQSLTSPSSSSLSPSPSSLSSSEARDASKSCGFLPFPAGPVVVGVSTLDPAARPRASLAQTLKRQQFIVVQGKSLQFGDDGHMIVLNGTFVRHREQVEHNPNVRGHHMHRDRFNGLKGVRLRRWALLADARLLLLVRTT